MRPLLLLAVTLLGACGDRTAAVPDLVPFQVAGFSQFAQAGDLILGGQPTPGALRQLADRGFAAIVSTRAAAELDWDEEATVVSLGMRFIRIPVPLPVSRITPAQVAALDRVLASPGGPVVVHCAGGTRAAALWAVWLSETHGVDPAVTLRRAELAGMKILRPTAEQLLGATGP
jgi:uncharacterized protein (TIGR01244 family)